MLSRLGLGVGVGVQANKESEQGLSARATFWRSATINHWLVHESVDVDNLVFSVVTPLVGTAPHVGK